MNATKRLFSVLIFVGLASPAAQAGLMLEPYLGYTQGQVYDARPALGMDLSYKSSGIAIGGRVGYSFPVMFWTALDYSMTNGKGKMDILSSDGDLTRSDLYATFGVDLPILLRAWISYGLMNSSTIKPSTGGDVKYSGGTNLKAGVGISVFPFVSMNLEFFDHKGQKVESTLANETLSDFQDTGGILSLSIPLDL